jgi:Flp pilus assembly protein TadD
MELNRQRDAAPTIERGRQFLTEGEKDEKLEFFTQAIQRFPDVAEIRCLYAEVLRYVRPDDAVSEALRAVELDPREPVLLTRVAYIMSELDHPELARRYAAQARELGGSDFLFAAELDHLESRFALEGGDEDAAEKGFRLSFEREPQGPMFAVDLARFLGQRGRRDEALEVIERGLRNTKWKDELMHMKEELEDE